MSTRVVRLVEHYFPEGTARHEARRLLEEGADCGAPEDLDRIRFAALKTSRGDLRKLVDALALSKIDYRDLLMAADFGFDTEAHERWYEETMRT